VLGDRLPEVMLGLLVFDVRADHNKTDQAGHAAKVLFECLHSAERSARQHNRMLQMVGEGADVRVARQVLSTRITEHAKLPASLAAPTGLDLVPVTALLPAPSRWHLVNLALSLKRFVAQKVPQLLATDAIRSALLHECAVLNARNELSDPSDKIDSISKALAQCLSTPEILTKGAAVATSIISLADLGAKEQPPHYAPRYRSVMLSLALRLVQDWGRRTVRHVPTNPTRFAYVWEDAFVSLLELLSRCGVPAVESAAASTRTRMAHMP